MDRVALADDPVLVGATDLGVLVVVVGIVGADFHGLVDRPVKLRGLRVGVLEEGLESGPGESAEVTEALRAVEQVVRGAFREDGLPGGLEGVAELVPGLAGSDAVDGGLVADGSSFLLLVATRYRLSAAFLSPSPQSMKPRSMALPKRASTSGRSQPVKQSSVM